MNIESMRVFVLVHLVEYEPSTVMGVYSSRQLAEDDMPVNGEMVYKGTTFSEYEYQILEFVLDNPDYED